MCFYSSTTSRDLALYHKECLEFQSEKDTFLAISEAAKISFWDVFLLSSQQIETLAIHHVSFNGEGDSLSSMCEQKRFC